MSFDDEIKRVWRYSLEKDFVDGTGLHYTYAVDGKRTWGDEMKCIKLDKPPECFAVNHDQSMFALSIVNTVHLFNSNYDCLGALRGHEYPIEAICFQPGNPNVLVTFEQQSFSSYDEKPKIIIWNLQDKSATYDLNDDIADNAVRDAVASIQGTLSLYSIDLSLSNRELLKKALEKPVDRAIVRSINRGQTTLVGRQARNKGLSGSGKFLMYMAGGNLRSHGCWDMKVFSMSDKKDYLVLTGHQDLVTWMGFSPSDTWIGSAAMDNTFRIWDPRTGEQRYLFRTDSENTAAGFSPDEKMFAGASKTGMVHIYSLETGQVLFSLDSESRCRTLDWSPDSQRLVVGERAYGRVILIDVKGQQVVQERALSMKGIKHESRKTDCARLFSVGEVRFVDFGRKIAFRTACDQGIELYDIVAGKKWRIAVPGPDDDNGEAEGKVIRKRGNRGMEVWQDDKKGALMIASIDSDAVRIWSFKTEPSGLKRRYSTYVDGN